MPVEMWRESEYDVCVSNWLSYGYEVDEKKACNFNTGSAGFERTLLKFISIWTAWHRSVYSQWTRYVFSSFWSVGYICDVDSK